MTPLLVACALGTVAVDLDEEEDAEVVDDALPATDPPAVELPLLVAAAAHGSTVVAVVDRRPPLVVSNDGGRTWREAGAGLGRAVAVAISPVHPDLVAVATEERIHVSHDGGRFWSALAVELPAITAIAFPPVAGRAKPHGLRGLDDSSREARRGCRPRRDEVLASPPQVVNGVSPNGRLPPATISTGWSRSSEGRPARP